MRILATIILVLLLHGCATTSSDPSFVHVEVPSERVVLSPRMPEPSKSATVRVMRDAQFKGGAMTTTLTFNGQDMAHIKSGEAHTFKVGQGEHILGLRFLGNDSILGALTLGIARPKRFIESATTFVSGGEYFFRIVDNANWEWELKRSSR